MAPRPIIGGGALTVKLTLPDRGGEQTSERTREGRRGEEKRVSFLGLAIKRVLH